MPRLKSAIWVAAFLRQNQIEGRFGAVIHKGAEEAGTVFVVINHLDGTFHLFGPAPGAAHDEDGNRRWRIELAPPAAQQDVNDRVARQRRFDSDLWLVEIEDRKGTAGLHAVCG